ncbi:MAG: iron-containing alcohol dehydrogenase [Methylococcales bacterium]|nr:iron-containing alcohol dehydrogenase [Methylococcales bacterium]
MMENFTAFNPTRLHFGHDVVHEIGNHASRIGNHALLVYGRGSVLKNGSYLDTIGSLKQHNIKVTEYSGIKPNPSVNDVMEATQIGRENEVDMVVAVGGGSVIDSAKLISICIAENCDAWEVMTKEYEPKLAVPILAVLTLAATGTEMNSTAVLQNRLNKQKLGFKHELMFPMHSYLDPAYTLSAPENYTAYGIVDLVAHCLEAWFGKGDASLSDRFVISIIKEAMEYGPALMKDLGNFKLRAKIMWAATNALNSLTIYGRTSGDWGVHILGHTLSVLYDTPHGATLSIIYPAWMKVMRNRAGERISELGQELFGNPSVEDTIVSFEKFFSDLGCPIKCQDVGIESSSKKEILHLMNKNPVQSLNYKLSDAEREEVLVDIF